MWLWFWFNLMEYNLTLFSVWATVRYTQCHSFVVKTTSQWKEDKQIESKCYKARHNYHILQMLKELT
jgi:capsule polysaccharide export protein KpsE/RkpR